MKKTPNRLKSTEAELRRQAEKQLKGQRRKTVQPGGASGAQRLVHELQVHQVELEMQNAELQRARTENEEALEKYTELYDFAPLGYFSIDQKGLIREVNLMGAAMFGAVRSQLLHRRLQDFVAPTSRSIVSAFLKVVFTKTGKQACEALLTNTSNETFWADLQAVSSAWPDGKGSFCRLAVSDIAALKRGEEAQRSVQSLAAANREANREIARRREAEASLKESEQNQHKLLVEAQELHAQLRYLTHQIIQAQEEERKQISRELHDDIAQILAGVKVQLTTLSVTASIQPQDLRRRIRKTKELVGKSIEVVHEFARKLRPALLDDLGLIPALRSFIKELPKTGLRLHLDAAEEVETLDSACRTVIYRVAQEAITNVVRHAHAQNVTLRIMKTAGVVRLVVHDDGRSFPAKRLLAAKQGGRLGLLGMRERIEMVGGHFDIESLPAKGTTITAEIPWVSGDKN